MNKNTECCQHNCTKENFTPVDSCKCKCHRERECSNECGGGAACKNFHQESHSAGDWERAFDEAIKIQFNGGEPYWPNWDSVKTFIKQTIASERERIVGVLEGMKIEASELTSQGILTNAVLNDAISAIKEV